MPVLPLITGALGGIASAYGARKQQQASAAMAQKQMDFQERMSSTAYQRAAKDLEAAGLNRILALGSPASSPGGAMGQAQNIMGAGVSSAAQSAQAAANIQATSAQARKTGYEADIMGPKAAIARRGEKVVDTTLDTIEENIPAIKEWAGKGLDNFQNFMEGQRVTARKQYLSKDPATRKAQGEITRAALATYQGVIETAQERKEYLSEKEKKQIWRWAQSLAVTEHNNRKRRERSQ